MQFSTYLAEIEAAIRERGVPDSEISLAYTDGSYNRTYDGESVWRRGKVAARVLQGATPLQSVIQWLDGPTIDHSSKAVVGENATKGVAMEIIDRLRRGF